MELPQTASPEGVEGAATWLGRKLGLHSFNFLDDKLSEGVTIRILLSAPIGGTVFLISSFIVDYNSDLKSETKWECQLYNFRQMNPKTPVIQLGNLKRNVCCFPIDVLHVVQNDLRELGQRNGPKLRVDEILLGHQRHVVIFSRRL